MRVGVDVRMIDSSGIGTTIRETLNHFSPEQKERLTLYGRPGWENQTGCDAKTVPYKIYGLRQHWSYARFLEKEPISLFHMPHYDVPLTYRGPFVATVYDLIHYLFPQHSTKPFTRPYSWLLLRHVSLRARHIIAISEATKRDLVKVFPEAEPKITVLPLAVGASFKPATELEKNTALAAYGLKPGYALYVGNLRESKNIPRLLRAYANLAREKKGAPPLVLAGQNSLNGIALDSIGPSVKYVGKIPAGRLNALYSAASAFVFPSLYEGFGLPPLEAMACGTPAVVSNVASLPEVCGDAAVYADPLSEADIARAIWSVVSDPRKQAEMRQKGFDRVKRFSWDAFAKGVWRVYEQAA